MILLVDDDEAIQKYLPYVLERAGYRVEVAGGGHEAIVWLENNLPPDLVLLDLRMPDVDGNAVLAYVQARDWGRYAPPPIVVLTAYPGDVADEVRGVPKDIKEKPLYGDGLMEVIARYANPDKGAK